MISLLKIVSLFITLSVATAFFTGCKEVEPVEDFDLEEYVSAPWYIHEQAITTYSPLEWNYCTRAVYGIRDTSTFWGYEVSVNNYAQDENGEEQGGPLCAYQSWRKPDGLLGVAPCFLPKLFAGPYLVVEYNEDEGYALISGGQPYIQTKDGLCRTSQGTNNAGLWIFSRSQTRNDTMIRVVREAAIAKGIDPDVMNPVDQTDCDYPPP